MFHRINQVHVFILYALSLINNETELSFATKRVFERLISLLHTPISIEDFHTPDFENFSYLGESRASILEIIRRKPGKDIRDLVDFERTNVQKSLIELENNHKIKRILPYKYEIDATKKFEELEK